MLSTVCDAEVRGVGISAIEIYFPRNVVNQADLEMFEHISPGKYTVGLGQHQMGFCADNEDIVSVALTVTSNILDNYEIDPSSIGFLAVGTETLIDKSKSVKTELMRLFGDNHDIEGVDVKNACFGGTQAVFHAIDWVYANYNTEKRNAMAVLADIAVYEAGPARCTGGAGAIAVLITPDAPIAFERGLRGTYMSGGWDFYKPIGNISTEYPMVDGPISLKSYMSALEGCYKIYKEKTKRITGEDISLSSFSAAMFHSPFARMVQKALARLAYRDYQAGHASGKLELYNKLGIIVDSSFDEREVVKCLLSASNEIWKEKTDPNLEINRRVGNMYTPSLFAQLITYLYRGYSDDLNRVLFFAYGSGSASAMFSAFINPTDERLRKMQQCSQQAVLRLNDRQVLSPQLYTDVLNMREKFLAGEVPIVPTAMSRIYKDLPLFPGTYYLASVDAKHRRTYEKFELLTDTNSVCNGHCNGYTTNELQ